MSVVTARVLKMLKCKQIEKGNAERNDRVIVVPIDGKSRKPMQPSLKFDVTLLNAIAAFFVEYNKLQGKQFRIIGIEAARAALAAIRKRQIK